MGHLSARHALVLALSALLAISGLVIAPPANAELAPTPDATWQVVTHIPDSIGLDTLVWDFAELDGVMYVAGSFAEVRSSTGGNVTSQPHLAAFDVDSGAWISTFRPVLDGAVFSVEAAPDGSHLMIGGEFTGAVRALDPADGSTMAWWNTNVVHDAGQAAVMDLEPDGSGGWYFGGYLTHVNDGNGQQRRHRLARIDSSGNLDPTWRPRASGGRIFTIAASKVRSWVHVGGKHTSMNGEPDTGFFTTVSDTTGATVTTVPHGYPDGAVSSEGYIAQKIFALEATSDMLWLGGEPHTLVALDPVTLEVQKWWFTNSGLGDRSAGGDIQDIYVTGDRVYAGCHCWGGVDTFDPIGPNDWPVYPDFVAWFRTQVRDDVSGVFAVDKATMAHSQTFLPDLTGDDGVWAIIEDSNGRVWFGGEFTSAGGAYPGGFVRYTDTGAATTQTLIDNDATWDYQIAAANPPATWTSVGFDATSWRSGQAELGFGDGNEVTTLDTAAWSRSAYFRHEVTITNADTATDLALNITADDGYVAYLNGVEVARNRVPAGPLSYTTWATQAVWGPAETTPERVTIPASLLQDGTNVLAVQVHNASDGGDLSFSASLEAAASQDLVEPPAPLAAPVAPNILVADFTNATQVSLRWNHPRTSSVALYEVRRNGQLLTTTLNSNLVDRNVVAGETHTYEIVAYGLDGQASPPSNPVQITVGTKPELRRSWARLIATDWRWTGNEPASAWLLPAFDDASWNDGTDRIGFGQNGMDTIVAPTDNLWLRSTVTVSQRNSESNTLLLMIEADDAGIIYLNGHEIWRKNLAPGPVDATSAPLEAFWASIDERRHYTLIPGDLLLEGENTFAMQVNNATPSDDLFASLGALTLDYAPAQAPTAPGAPQAAVGTNGVQLTWTAATDDIGVASYAVLRDGVMVGVADHLTFFDPVAQGTYSYQVEAMDTFGNRTASSATSVTVGNNPPPPPPPPPVEPTVTFLTTTAANFTEGWAIVTNPDGSSSRQWVNAACRTSLEAAGAVFTPSRWSTISGHPSTASPLSCSAIEDLFVDGGGDNGGQNDGNVDFLTTSNPAFTEGWAIVTAADGSTTRQWLPATCRAALEAAGASFTPGSWSLISAHPGTAAPLSCVEIQTLAGL